LWVCDSPSDGFRSLREHDRRARERQYKCG